MKKGYKVKKSWIFITAFVFILAQLFIQGRYDLEKNGPLCEKVCTAFIKSGVELYDPYMLYMNDAWEEGNLANKLMYLFYKDMPLEMCALEAEDENSYVTEYLQEADAQENIVAEDNDLEQGEIETETFADNSLSLLEQAVLDENAAATNILEDNTVASNSFVPVQAPAATYSEEQLSEPGFIKQTFYSEDATTQIREDQLDYNTLMGFDASLKQDNQNIQILVYHTHSQEAYIDSVQGDVNTSIVGVGEYLCEILRTQYGFNVLHHMGEYDIDGRDYAYSNAMVGLEQVLAQNPTIEVIIDLHRDATSADTRLVTTIQNKTMAKFMFFNGLCYTRELGNLDNLPNPYVQDNLSFAFQMQLAAEEYYPGIARRIYLKGYRYNLHYRPKSLLIELGSQTNTVEEAMNSCEPLAHIIAMVLNGENKQ